MPRLFSIGWRKEGGDTGDKADNEKRSRTFLNLDSKRREAMETIRTKKTIVALGVIFLALVLFSSS